MEIKPSGKIKFIIGIDEVGRGPLAGPVAVGAVAATPQVIRRFRAIKESKQLTAHAREVWHARINEDVGPSLRYSVSFVSAKIIDKNGIVWAIRDALRRSIEDLDIDPTSCKVLLDGGLKAPEQYVRQQTIIRGDALHTIIAMASVLAKVERDRKMVKLSKKMSKYDFASHKGYGTRMHIKAIREHGPSMHHRSSFLKKILAEPTTLKA